LGADQKAFSKLTVEGYILFHIPWLQPLAKETLQQYALRMRQSIKEDNPILMGLSFGGIMCTEIAKQIPVEKIIIISSIKSSAELPFWMRTVAKLSLHKIVPLRSTKLSAPLQNFFLGANTLEDKRVAGHYRKHTDMKYIKWAVNEVLNWKNDWLHSNLYHIHGTKDKMFPLKKIKPTYIINSGGHFMIMNKADEVSHYINLILQNGH
jgi:pimeloyl-ACP methyl ester carboxylesterase